MNVTKYEDTKRDIVINPLGQICRLRGNREIDLESRASSPARATADYRPTPYVIDADGNICRLLRQQSEDTYLCSKGGKQVEMKADSIDTLVTLS